MLAITYQEALIDNGCLNLMELQYTAQHLGWKQASANGLTFACYLYQNVKFECDLSNSDQIASAPNNQLASLACQIKLPIYDRKIAGPSYLLSVQSRSYSCHHSRDSNTFHPIRWAG